MQKDIQQTWFFNQSPEEVWDYLTKPELMEQWLMKTDFRPVQGHQFSFTFAPKPGSAYEGIVQCEVLEVTPFTRLSYTWNGSTQDHTRQFNSTVHWTLVPKDNGTELRLRHDGFDVLEDILAHTTGWNACIKRMEEHLHTVQK